MPPERATLWGVFCQWYVALSAVESIYPFSRKCIMKTHEFDSLVRKSHDYLYANSSIKTPESLQGEFAKLIMVLVAEARGIVDDRPLLVGQEFEWITASYKKLQKIKPDWNWGPFELDENSSLWILKSLAGIDFSNSERDFLGDALEVMRSTDAKRLGGQFFTDQRITELAMTLLQYDPLKHDFLDICAGTGGFLIPAIKRASKHPKSQAVKGVEIDSKISRLAQSTISHFSSAKKDLVINADSLKDPSEWDSSVRKELIPGTHQRLGSNPPFGAKIKIQDPKILAQYDLAKRWKLTSGTWIPQKTRAPRAPEILFVERNLQLAEPGKGICSLVLPYQILSGPQLGYVRHWLLTQAQIISIVDLPSDTFQPWTGTKTCVITFKRRKKPLTDLSEFAKDPQIFMSVAEHIGHDRRGNPILDSKGNIKQDITDVGKAYLEYLKKGNFTKIHKGSFEINPSEILQSGDLRLNAAFYNRANSDLMKKIANLPDNSDLKALRIGDLVERIFCPGRFKRNYVESNGVPFLGGSNITQFSLHTEKALSKTDEHLEELLVKPGWILVTRSGSTGIVSRVPDAWGEYAISDHVIRIVPKENNEVITGYIEAFLRSRNGQEMLSVGIFGSVIDEITPDFIGDMVIPVPKKTKDLESIGELMNQVLHDRDAVAKNLKQAQDKLAKLLTTI